MYKLELFEDFELDGIDYNDYPDFCDAFILKASYKGKDATYEELDWLNEQSDFIYELVLKIAV